METELTNVQLEETALVLLTALANEFDIEIEEAVEEKFFNKDQNRQWQTSVRQTSTR